MQIRKRAMESAEEAELVPPKLNHVTGEPATTNLTTTPNVAVLPASSGICSLLSVVHSLAENLLS